MLDKLKEPALLKLIISLSAVAIISRTFHILSPVYYLLPVLFVIIFFAGYNLVISDKNLFTLVTLFFVFGFWCGLSAFWSSYPIVTLTRTVSFIFISWGAVLSGYIWIKLNPDSFSFLLPANIIIITLSLFSLITGIPPDSWTAGHGKGFLGFAAHQNTLASAIIFTLPGLIRERFDVKKKLNLIFLVLISINLFILLLTYSRASILALIIGVISFLILSKKWRIMLYSLGVLAVAVFIINITPSLKQKSVDLIKKDFPEFYSSRLWMWEPSYKAALNGGLTGLGYGISDPDILLPGTGSHYEGNRYVREKGNSVLALIEETGIIGLLLFILPVGYAVKSHKLFRKSREKSKNDFKILFPAIIISIVVALTIHTQFEAWWVGVGSIQLPLFFFYLGCAGRIKTDIQVSQAG
jgi:O-antigen ligase